MQFRRLLYTRETVEENSAWVIERKKLERPLGSCETKIHRPASIRASLQLWDSSHLRLDQTMASTERSGLDSGPLWERERLHLRV